jgi:hypothetical protein
MNIFALSSDPVEAAQMQCDKHTNKMVVESAQMLSTAHRMLDGRLERSPSKSGKRMVDYWVHPTLENILYKAVHHKHPCTVWSMMTRANYQWHYEHFVALCDEFTYRYEKKHLTDRLLREVLQDPPINIPAGPLTPQPLAMKSNPECMDESDVVGSYRKYYQTKQERFKMVWSKREIPGWFVPCAT